jgi:hypothetical protein
MSLKNKLAVLSVAGMSLLAGSTLAAPGPAINTLGTPNRAGSFILVRGGGGGGGGGHGGFGAGGGGHAGGFGHRGGFNRGFGPLPGDQCTLPYNPNPLCKNE